MCMYTVDVCVMMVVMCMYTGRVCVMMVVMCLYTVDVCVMMVCDVCVHRKGVCYDGL